ncbi:alpha-glucosidase [Pseudoroseicyclus aestuarii]|uniref:Alpha-glucosidase n=1 Tax=Pseudoroseicyclus aestuarii TaxID=1795041 RepID=A0A318SP53_9RHOB|nr:alpha-glucosidase [Pseudoroseicyclus aestuarii]
MTGCPLAPAPTIYQIYPRSFRDTTGSGIGDLNGVTEGLEAIAALGVDAIWIGPFYPSPWDDGGYDITDYRAVDERLGTLEDFDRLLARAHELGLKVLIDQVLNHTSCEHPWFERAIAGDEDCAEYYVWRDPKPDGTAPNNWLSQFGEPGWMWNHKRRQYYFHQFLACQPSLDLRHPRVKEEHRKTLKFWVDRGVDGFRFDAVTSFLFDGMEDNPPASPEVKARVSGDAFNPYTYQDHVYDILPGDGAAYAENLRDWAGEHLWLMGESTAGNNSVELALSFSEPHRLNACYTTDPVEKGRDPQALAALIDAMQGQFRLPWWFSSHDQPRSASSLGDGGPRGAKFLALLRAVLPGALILYQGEELGLPQPHLEKSENGDYYDRLYWPDGPGREGARVPIPWLEDDGSGGWGFTTGTSWLPMRWQAGHSRAAQEGDEDSVLHATRAALAARRAHGWEVPDALEVEATDQVLRLTITTGAGRWRAVFNFSEDAPHRAPEAASGAPEYASGAVDGGLPPLTGAIWRL